jgi:hypothetical protein
MSAVAAVTTRRRFLATLPTAACALVTSLRVTPGLAQIDTAADAETSVISQTSTPVSAPVEPPRDAIRPFNINVPDTTLIDLRRRIAATRWPDPETVSHQSRGVQLARIQELVRYWGTDYNWRPFEAKLNALPQFVTNLDGLDIQFHPYQVSSRERVAVDHDARLARLGRGAAQGGRPAHGPNGVRWHSGRRLPSCAAVHARLRLFG